MRSFIALLTLTLCACEPYTFRDEPASAQDYTQGWRDCEHQTEAAIGQFRPGIQGQVDYRAFWDECMKKKGLYY